MLRCKENDLAVVLKGPYTGYFVTVGKFIGTVPGISRNGEHITLNNVWEVISKDVKPRIGGNRTAVRDRNLQPIRPGKVNVTTEKEVSA